MNDKEEHKYDDIIHLPHHVSVKHPQMPALSRAAQFSPFAALTGHGAAIEETARLTEDFAELDEDRKAQLDLQLQQIKENLSQQPEVTITYFQPDKKKNGGAYRTIHSRVKKIDLYNHRILFTDGTTLPLEHLYAIEMESPGDNSIQPGGISI